MAEKPAYARSIFNQFFASDSVEVQAWCDNMVDKMYKRGIVPDYIVRGDNNNANNEDEDYISYWTSVSTYFAWLVIYSRKFLDVDNDASMLYDYLTDKGMAVCPDDTLSDMNVVMNNLYDEVRKRGTKYVFEKASSYTPTTTTMSNIHNLNGLNNLDGEFLRAICSEYFDEFIYSISSGQNFGWCVGRCSPLYRGTGMDYQLIKGYETTEDVIDISQYPLIGNPVSAIDVSVGKSIMFMSGTPCGFGYVSGVPTKKIVINQSMSYEMTFMLKVDNDANVIFGVDFFDQYDNQLPSSYIDTTPSGGEFFNGTMNRSNEYYGIRGIAFGVNTPNRFPQDSMLDIGFGKHIKIPCTAVYMIPKIIMTDTGVHKSASIQDFKVRVCDTPYSRGFVQVSNVFQIWAKNNNGKNNEYYQKLNNVIHPISFDSIITIPLLEEFVKRYLIPYNSTAIFNWLSVFSTCSSHAYDDSYNDSYTN